MTPEAAAQVPSGTARVPRGFVLLVSAVQDTVQELLPRINGNFVKSPFALFAATNSLMTEALQHDPALRARTADFLGMTRGTMRFGGSSTFGWTGGALSSGCVTGGISSATIFSSISRSTTACDVSSRRSA